MKAFWRGVASIMDIFGGGSIRRHQILERNRRPDADYQALKGDWEKVIGPQMDVPRRSPTWSTKPNTENPTRPEVKYKGQK